VRSEIAQQPAEIVSRFGWLKRLKYEPVQYLPVPADLLMFMDVKCAGELLDISHAGYLVDAEAEWRLRVTRCLTTKTQRSPRLEAIKLVDAP
jgi:hypothetical protein